MNEKLKLTLKYFEDEEITLPTDVKNSLEDVFAENDDIDEVECYHSEDLESFQEDITLKNSVFMYLDGSNKGDTCNVWTYYGGINYALNEHIGLYDKDGKELEEISDLAPDDDFPYSLVENPSIYEVVLIERVHWDTSKEEFSRNLHLYIFCPDAPKSGLTEEDDKYEAIYNELKRGA